MSHFSTINTQLKEAEPLIKALNNLGAMHRRQGNWAAAQKSFETAIRINPDFAEAWMDGLREELDRDFQAITNLFTANRFGEEPVELKPEDAEGIIRACSAVRLWLRNHRLEDVPDPSLETGVVDLEALKPEPRLAYFTYGLLAYLQESLIELLDGA